MSDTKQIAEWLRVFGFQHSMISGRAWHETGLSVIRLQDMQQLYESTQRDKQRIAELEVALQLAQEPDELWSAEDPETSHACGPADLARSIADSLYQGESRIVEVVCAKQLPNRLMHVSAPVDGDNDATVNWKWIERGETP